MLAAFKNSESSDAASNRSKNSESEESTQRLCGEHNAHHGYRSG